jgi:hypothetical protein
MGEKVRKRWKKTAICLVVSLNVLIGIKSHTWIKGSTVEAKAKTQIYEWVQSTDGRWWILLEDGSYPRNQWFLDKDTWYYFDQEGYMVTGWVYLNHQWYYLDQSGAMVKNEYVGPYYVNHSGMWTNTRDGEWRLNETGWWYEKEDGSYPAGEWKLIKDKWYYFGLDGYMLTGWINGTKPGEEFYSHDDGAILINEEAVIHGERFFFDERGAAVFLPDDEQVRKGEYLLSRIRNLKHSEVVSVWWTAAGWEKVNLSKGEADRFISELQGINGSFYRRGLPDDDHCRKYTIELENGTSFTFGSNQYFMFIDEIYFLQYFPLSDEFVR